MKTSLHLWLLALVGLAYFSPLPLQAQNALLDATPPSESKRKKNDTLTRPASTITATPTQATSAPDRGAELPVSNTGNARADLDANLSTLQASGPAGSVPSSSDLPVPDLDPTTNADLIALRSAPLDFKVEGVAGILKNKILPLDQYKKFMPKAEYYKKRNQLVAQILNLLVNEVNSADLTDEAKKQLIEGSYPTGSTPAAGVSTDDGLNGDLKKLYTDTSLDGTTYTDSNLASRLNVVLTKISPDYKTILQSYKAPVPTASGFTPAKFSVPLLQSLANYATRMETQ